MHPAPEEDKPLFVGLCTKSYGNSLSYTMCRNIVKRAVAGAGIKKRITPHTFRHSRATHLASTLTESEMCHHLGWELGSDMPKIYVHLSAGTSTMRYTTRSMALKLRTASIRTISNL
ncbi:MAG: tyrosine-type recombinase/integrase [Methanofastidiosum sp.]|nr:tyrosine-type recombinase/integrase [Methanofastidiosum sp.]